MGDRPKYPEFSCKQFFLSTGILLFDALLAFVWVLVVGWLIRYASAQHIIRHIIENAPWPATVIFIVLVFRTPLMRILYEVPWFIRKSSYGGERKDLMKTATELEVQQKQTENKKFGVDCADGEFIEKDEVLQNLQTRYAKPIMRDIRLANTSYVFDGVMDLEGSIIGVEILQCATIEEFDHRAWAIARAYNEFPKKLKAKFSLLFYFTGCGEDDENILDSEVSRISKLLPYPVKIDHYRGRDSLKNMSLPGDVNN